MADNRGGEIVVYETPDGEVRVDVRLERETVWLTQRQMAALFETTPENVVMHLNNVFGDEELEQAATTKDFLVFRLRVSVAFDAASNTTTSTRSSPSATA